MTLKLVIHRAAQQEFDEAADWYNEQQVGLGDQFIDAVTNLLTRIVHQPGAFPLARMDVRQATMNKPFPYQIHFRTLKGRIRVLSIFHTSRNPHIWQRRR